MNVATKRFSGWPEPGTVITALDQLQTLELDAMPAYPPVQQLLMFDPQHTFQVVSDDNPHMPPHIGRACSKRAREEWAALKETFETAIPVGLITGEIVSPDMVFAANFGLLGPGNVAVVSNMVKKGRKEEKWTFLRWLIEQGYTARWVETHFEGQGDGLRPPGKALLLGGHGFRTRPESWKRVGSYLGLTTVALQLVNPWLYHLDTCFCPLGDGRVLYYPTAFSKEAVSMIEYIFPRRAEVSEADAIRFACNSVSVGDKLFMPHCSDELRSQLEAMHVESIVTPHTQLPKSGGANACTVLLKY